MGQRASRRAARAPAARLGFGVAMLAVGLACVPVWGAAAPPRSVQLLWRESGVFLELTPPQRQTLETLQSGYHRRLQALRESDARSASLGTPSPLICQQATEARTEWLTASRNVLTPPQLTRLAQLEAAFLLMPVIESAQAAGLMDDRLALPPRGLPDGRVTQMSSWLRVPAPPLPGCPAAVTTVTPEVERHPPDASASRPRR